MQDPNNPEDEEFFDGEFDQEFDEFDQFGDMPDEAAAFDEPAGQDFSSPSADDDSFMDAGWDDFDESQEDNAGKKNKRGGSRLGGGLSFNTIVIGIAVIVGLCVLAYQVLSTPAPSGSSRFQSVLDFTGSTDGPVLGQHAPQDSAAPGAFEDMQNIDGGFLDNPDILDGAVPADDPSDLALDGGLPMPSPISNDIDDHGMDQDIAAMSEPVDVLTPMPDISFAPSQGVPRAPDALAEAPAVEEESSPALDIIRRAQTQQQQVPQDADEAAPPVIADAAQEAAPPAEPVQEAAPAPVTEPAPAPAPAPTAADSGAQQEILARLESLSNRLGVMEQQIVQLRESGQTDLDGLEQEISALKSGMSAVADATGAPPAPVAKREPPKAAAKPAPAPKKAAPRPAATPSSAAASPAGAGTWELRAAQPGRAWVSRPGSREMQSITPGDTLAGIGQIVRIDYAAGRWTVVGTQGQIRQ